MKDDGVGLPQDLDLHGVDTLGLKLVNILVRQLKGNVELVRVGGSEFRITADCGPGIGEGNSVQRGE